jgi:hypothetical protein
LNTITSDVTAALRSVGTAQAVLAAGIIIAGAILVAGLGRGAPVYQPNPQGGIWVEKAGTLFLCRAALDKPAPCVDMATGETTTFAAVDGRK